MMDRKLFQDTFSALHASEDCIQEVLTMTENKTTAQKTRWLRRPLLMTAAVMVSLCVCAGVANAATGGALAQAIELHIVQAFQANDYKNILETEEGATIITFGTPVTLTREDNRVLLHIDEETLDITETLEQNGTYTYENTDGDTTLRVVVTPDQEHPGEWSYQVSYSDPTLKENEELSSFGSTAPKDAESIPDES